MVPQLPRSNRSRAAGSDGRPIQEPELGTVVALRDAAASTTAMSRVIRGGMEFSGGTSGELPPGIFRGWFPRQICYWVPELRPLSSKSSSGPV
jgi:hypothetical protein